MNKKSKNKVKATMSCFNKVLWAGICISVIVSIILSRYFSTKFELNENQLLYLFSAMAQIIGGVFGLTLTAYVFFVDKFKESTKDDEILYDASMAILNRYFHILISLAITCGAIIFLCILGIIDLHNYKTKYSFIINEGVFLFLIGIAAILTFGALLLDPSKLDKEIEKMKKDAEKYYQDAHNPSSGDFREFLKTYNLLEHLIIEFAAECMKGKDVRIYNYKPQIIQSLNVLYRCEIINDSLQSEIHGLRMYRNGLVHGVDFNVPQDICDRISKIYTTLQHVFNAFKDEGTNSVEFRKAIQQLYDMTR